jgi:hypothetical protein
LGQVLEELGRVLELIEGAALAFGMARLTSADYADAADSRGDSLTTEMSKSGPAEMAGVFETYVHYTIIVPD